MRVGAPRIGHDNGGVQLTVDFFPIGASPPVPLWFQFEGRIAEPERSGDAFAVCLLTAAMFEQRPMEIDAPVSSSLLSNMERAQDVLSRWHDYLRPIRIEAIDIGAPAAPPVAGGIACCFSGGVDSWFSSLSNVDRITHLILVRGFDIGLANDALWRETKNLAARVADTFGKELVLVTTNLRQVADKRRSVWGRRHDGFEFNRVEKVRALAQCPTALETLRVCYNDTQSYNCGRCEKCIRTMLALRICRALDRATTFAAPLDLADVQRLEIPANIRHRYIELRDAAADAGDVDAERAIVAALADAALPTRLVRHYWRHMRHRVRQSMLGQIYRQVNGAGGAIGP